MYNYFHSFLYILIQKCTSREKNDIIKIGCKLNIVLHVYLFSCKLWIFNINWLTFTAWEEEDNLYQFLLDYCSTRRMNWEGRQTNWGTVSARSTTRGRKWRKCPSSWRMPKPRWPNSRSSAMNTWSSSYNRNERRMNSKRWVGVLEE